MMTERIYKRGIEKWSEKGPCCPECRNPMSDDDIVGSTYKHPLAFKRHCAGGRTTSDKIICRCHKCGKLYEVHFLIKTTPCYTNVIEYK